MPAPTQSIVRAMPRASATGPKARRTPPSLRVAGALAVSARAATAQYLILGSMYALTKSMIRLARTTMSANTTMIPWTAA